MNSIHAYAFSDMTRKAQPPPPTKKFLLKKMFYLSHKTVLTCSTLISQSPNIFLPLKYFVLQIETKPNNEKSNAKTCISL